MIQHRDLATALRTLRRPGAVVFVHAGPAESPALRAALVAEPNLAEGVTFAGVFLPGINDFDYGFSGAGVVSNFVPPSSRASFEAGRHRLLPLPYSDLTRYFAESGADLAVLHCPPPRGDLCSLGLNADFAFTAANAARRRLVIVNRHLPWTEGHEPVRLREDDMVVEQESLLSPATAAGGLDDAARAIAVQVAALVGDRDTIQIGIGKLPAAILDLLHDRRRLRFHSGIITDEVTRLAEAGVIRLDDPGAIVCGSAWGGATTHRLVADPRVAVAPASLTHDPRRIGAIDGFVALNSALEVDLLGQVNGEAVRGRRVSGVGGSNDFARGARLAPRGRSVIALPSTAGRHSRIVSLLSPGTVSQPATDADVVATEHGVARLRDLTLDERAEALIALADPSHRSELGAAWRDLRGRM